MNHWSEYDPTELANLCTKYQLTLDTINGIVYLPEDTIFKTHVQVYAGRRIYFNATKTMNPHMPLKSFSAQCDLQMFRNVLLEEV